MLKYITHENSEDGRSTVLTLEDEQGVRHKLLWDDVPRQLIDNERMALAYLYHDINHRGYEPPHCRHYLRCRGGVGCALEHPMDYFRVYCSTCPDVDKDVETIWNQPVKFVTHEEGEEVKMKVIEPQPPTQEEIEKKRREYHCTK